jgi:hypothetical protein
MEQLEKAADRSTRNELTTTEITDVLAAKFAVTVTSSSAVAARMCATRKKHSPRAPKPTTNAQQNWHEVQQGQG